MSKDFFLNILIVLMPVLVYQVIHDRSFHKTVKRSPWIIGILGGISAALCVKFPFVDGYGGWWDFRLIPLILAMVYGGYGAGLLALAMELAFRAYLGGDGAVFSILFTSLFMILPSLMVKRFYRFSFKRRMVTSIVLSLIAYLTHLTQLSFQIVLLEKVTFLLIIGLLQALTMALSVWLIENMILTYQLHAELQRSEKLSIISELAASVAHEIRNPLTVVRGFLQLLGGTVDPKKQQYMQTALSELDRAECIISDYLNFAKPLKEEEPKR